MMKLIQTAIEIARRNSLHTPLTRTERRKLVSEPKLKEVPLSGKLDQNKKK